MNFTCVQGILTWAFMLIVQALLRPSLKQISQWQGLGGVPTAWLAQQCELSYIQNGLRTMKKKTSQTPTSVPGVQARVAYSKQLATVGPLKPSVLKCDTHVTHNGTVETDSNWVQKPCMSQGSLSIRAGKLSPHCLSQHAVHLNAESVFTWHLSVP